MQRGTHRIVRIDLGGDLADSSLNLLCGKKGRQRANVNMKSVFSVDEYSRIGSVQRARPQLKKLCVTSSLLQKERRSMRSWKVRSVMATSVVVFALLCTFPRNVLAADPIKIKVVVVAMFESGEDTGDRPGEFQFWVEREKLDKILPFPSGYRPLRLSADQSVLGVVTGGGVTNSSTTIMALGLDPRFDVSKAYWIVAGIAGGDPNDVSLGSAAWANYVLD